MGLFLYTHSEGDLVVTEALSHGANGASGIITVRIGDLSMQLDETTAEKLEQDIAKSRQKLARAKEDHKARRVAA
ncbi:hypothetical protein [Thalassospira lucentensis]|uniref:hypothetical protein n=1 Tax=Thalassospira lucentensis TaxID=168935 RepID=UPI003D27B330|tara:strand:- start:6750 stop:6974 length:225 start_codon:yes stop_codon:yes gene_type:complete